MKHINDAAYKTIDSTQHDDHDDYLRDTALFGLARMEDTRHGFCVIRLCHGQVNDRSFFAYVAIEPHNIEYFETHYKPGQDSDFSPYGQELLRGWGSRPPNSVHDRVTQKYNIEFDVDQAFFDRLIALTIWKTSDTTLKAESPTKPAKISENTHPL